MRGKGQAPISRSEDQVLAALASSEQPLMPREIRERTGIKSGYLSDLLNLLMRTGCVVRRPKGYALTPRGQRRVTG